MSQYKKWTLDNLKEGIDRFYSENGRYPTVNDADRVDYLPSSRWIQLKFGGLIAVRKTLGYIDTHLGAGKYRTNISNHINQRGLTFEHEIEKFLVQKFGEQFVHIEKRIGDSRNRLDFYIYSVTKNFGIDVTAVDDNRRSLQTNINLKFLKYSSLNIDLYIVVSGSFSQEQLDSLVLTRAISLPQNWKVLTVANFMNEVSEFKRLDIEITK